MNPVCDNIHKPKLHVHNGTVHNNLSSESTVGSFDRNHTADQCHDSTSVTVLTPNRANYVELPCNSPISKILPSLRYHLLVQVICNSRISFVVNIIVHLHAKILFKTM